jgi:hypothetical protein
MVFSHAENTFRRFLIRETWGNANNKHIRVFYVLGQQGALSESKQHGDIIVSGTSDTNSNLTLKAVFSLHWAVRNCPDARYVMRTADDTLVNVQNLIQMISSNDLTYKIVGNCKDVSEVNRDKGSERYASYHSYPLKYYPRVCSADAGYIMTLQTASDIVIISEQIPYFHLEDIYISLCAVKLKVERIYLHPFNDSRYYPWPRLPEVNVDSLDIEYYCSCVVTLPRLLLEERHRLWFKSKRVKNCKLRSEFECGLMKKGIWRILNSDSILIKKQKT